MISLEPRYALVFRRAIQISTRPNFKRGTMAAETDETGETVVKCDSCGSADEPLAPMMHDAVWLQIAKEDEILCQNCAWDRSIERRGVPIRFADLYPCLGNLRHEPNSWFDVLWEPGAPISDQWRVAMERWEQLLQRIGPCSLRNVHEQRLLRIRRPPIQWAD